jgi:hypothetical protein
MCDHHHHGGSCAHEHTEEPEKERGAEYSLYQYVQISSLLCIRKENEVSCPVIMLECTHRYIDTGGLTCLNERGSGTVAKVFKPWDQRLDRTAVLLPPFSFRSRSAV